MTKMQLSFSDKDFAKALQTSAKAYVNAVTKGDNATLEMVAIIALEACNTTNTGRAWRSIRAKAMEAAGLSEDWTSKVIRWGVAASPMIENARNVNGTLADNIKATIAHLQTKFGEGNKPATFTMIRAGLSTKRNTAPKAGAAPTPSKAEVVAENASLKGKLAEAEASLPAPSKRATPASVGESIAKLAKSGKLADVFATMGADDLNAVAVLLTQALADKAGYEAKAA